MDSSFSTKLNCNGIKQHHRTMTGRYTFNNWSINHWLINLSPPCALKLAHHTEVMNNNTALVLQSMIILLQNWRTRMAVTSGDGGTALSNQQSRRYSTGSCTVHNGLFKQDLMNIIPG